MKSKSKKKINMEKKTAYYCKHHIAEDNARQCVSKLAELKEQ
jgi:hypothetical protein